MNEVITLESLYEQIQQVDRYYDRDVDRLKEQMEFIQGRLTELAHFVGYGSMNPPSQLDRLIWKIQEDFQKKQYLNALSCISQLQIETQRLLSDELKKEKK